MSTHNFECAMILTLAKSSCMTLTWTKFHHDFLVVNIKKHDNEPCLSSWYKKLPSLFINVSNSTVWSELFMSSSPSAAGDREDSTTMYSWGSIQGWTRIQDQNRNCNKRIYASNCEYNIHWYNTISHFSYFWVRSFTAISVVLMPLLCFCFMFWYYILYLGSCSLLPPCTAICIAASASSVPLFGILKLLVASGWAKFSTSGETQIHFLNWHVCHTCIYTCTEHNTDFKTIGLEVGLYDPLLYAKMFLKGILQLWMQIIMQNILMHGTFKWM